MPVYMVSFNGCDCSPIPDMAIRAENMVSAVMKAQEQLDVIQNKAEEADVDMCCDLSIESINEVSFELMDDVGIEGVVECWKEMVKH